MNRVCEVANRVQLMSRSCEQADWLSLAYFYVAHFPSFRPFFISPTPSFASLLLSPVPQPLLSPSFSGSQLYKRSMSESEWVSTLEAVNTLSTPAERWHLDVLDSKLLLFHDATRCNYSNIFALYPAAPATVKRRSWWDPGGAETSVSQSLPDLLQKTDWQTGARRGDGAQRENRGSHSNMPKDSVNSCILLKFLFLGTLRGLFRGLLTDSENVEEFCCCCSVDAGSEPAAAAATSSPVNNCVCNVITRSSLSVLHTVNPVGLIIKFNHTLTHNNTEEKTPGKPQLRLQSVTFSP